MDKLIDITKVVDMNTHMATWSGKTHEYSLYGLRTFTGIKVSYEDDNKKLRLTTNETKGKQHPFSRYFDDEAVALLEHAERNDLPVRVYVSKMTNKRYRGALVMALASDCSER